jgi:hypothetical protein
MTVPDGKIDAEAVPNPFVPIAQVVLKPIPKVARQSDVVKLVSTIQRINTLSATDVPSDNVLVFIQGFA